MLHLIKSISYALEGIQNALRLERNFRIHWLAGLFILSINGVMRFLIWEHGIMLMMIFFVMSLELINSAIERVCDSTGPSPNEHKKHAKDFAAAAVLLFSLAAVLVLMLIVEQNFTQVRHSIMENSLAWLLIFTMIVLNTPLCISHKITGPHYIAFLLNIVAMLAFMTCGLERPLFLVGIAVFQIVMATSLFAGVRVVRKA